MGEDQFALFAEVLDSPPVKSAYERVIVVKGRFTPVVSLGLSLLRHE
jgi:hypothetical protein